MQLREFFFLARKKSTEIHIAYPLFSTLRTLFSRRIRIGHSEKTRTKKLVNNESEGTLVCSVIEIYFGILPAVMENFHSAHQSATSPGNLGEEF